jgi:hypothetical protein
MNGTAIQCAWLERLETALPLFGHRDRIVVADPAYAAHRSAAVETVLATEDHPDMLRTVSVGQAIVFCGLPGGRRQKTIVCPTAYGNALAQDEILKTPTGIPYTPVFIGLGRGHRTAEAERKPRASLNSGADAHL